MKRHFETRGMFRLTRLGEVTSTNDPVKRALDDGEPEGFAVTALRQTAGYGRQGRAWQSPLGGMYLSVLLRPQVPSERMSSFSLVSALVIRRAVASLLVPDLSSCIKIKWPNDVVLDLDELRARCVSGRVCEEMAKRVAALTSEADGVQADTCFAEETFAHRFRKLSGISLEYRSGGLCVGMGVNVFAPENGLNVDGKNVPVFLSDLGYETTGNMRSDVFRVAEAVLDELEPLYHVWCECGFSALSCEYMEHASLTGSAIFVADNDGRSFAQGEVLRVDECGRLVLSTEQGDEIRVSSGEAHIRAIMLRCE